MRLRILVALAPLTLSMILVPGCGPAAATVTGEVIVDGKPVELGYVIFSPADKNGVSVTSEIKAGKYEIKTVVGKKYVAVSALKVVDKKKESVDPNSPWVDITEEILPERYNVKSELTYDVVAGPNTKDWKLDSKDKNP